MGVEIYLVQIFLFINLSCPARGMGVEIHNWIKFYSITTVMPREGHGSRNIGIYSIVTMLIVVMPREGHGSRNMI